MSSDVALFCCKLVYMPESLPPLASLIREGMSKKGFTTVRSLAIEMDTSAEHVRRYVNGSAVPTNASLRKLCSVLDISLRDASKYAAKQRIEDDFMRQALRDPGCVAVCKMWPLMQPEARKEVFDTVISLTRQSLHPGQYRVKTANA